MGMTIATVGITMIHVWMNRVIHVDKKVFVKPSALQVMIADMISPMNRVMKKTKTTIRYLLGIFFTSCFDLPFVVPSA